MTPMRGRGRCPAARLQGVAIGVERIEELAFGEEDVRSWSWTSTAWEGGDIGANDERRRTTKADTATTRALCMTPPGTWLRNRPGVTRIGPRRAEA
jgi:hypothetical protein